MLPFESQTLYLDNPDPYEACIKHLDEHSHYHDCLHCKHNATCDYGFHFLLGLRSLYNAKRYNLDLVGETYTQELVDCFNSLSADDEQFLQDFDETLQIALVSK